MGFNIANIDWKSINLLDILSSCADSYKEEFKKSESQVSSIARYRLKICKDCKMNVNGWCDNSGDQVIENVETKELVIGCGCNIKCKVFSKLHGCPAAKWKAIVV